jgi:two-component system, chemotaxis family, sensor kinase CheA
MIINSDISSEELKVFLEETDDILQTLDEDIIKLEKEDQKDDIIQRVFRAAHTLKGSSGMIGHIRMAEVTHAMENLLDKIRNKKMILNPNIVDLLLHSLDILKVLRTEINQEEDSDIDISIIVKRINEVIENPNSQNSAVVKNNCNYSGNKDSNETSINIDESTLAQISNAIESGLNPYSIKVTFNKDSIWKAVRCLQILNELNGIGKTLFSKPSSQEIEAENVNEELFLILCTESGEDIIQNTVTKIEEVDHIEIASFDLNQNASINNCDTEIQEQTDNQNTMHDENVDRNKSSDIPVIDKTEALKSVRVDVKLLDKLMNMVEELVIDRSRISQVGRELESRYQSDLLVGDLQETSNHIVKVINELYQDIMKVRMLPISIVFNKFPRLVRDLSQKQQKDINFSISGADTELDRNIIEQIRDPLIHLLRNAVDHGIESKEERKAQNKPEKAEILLSAKQEEGHILIVLEDDGKGIDTEKIKASAIKKGIITPESANTISHDEILDLIFAPGFSTADKITEISGRGVGLDIVRNNIEKLNGSVHLSTQINKGTIFTVKLPLTVAVFRGLMISIADSIFIIPMSSVIETKKIQPGDISTVLGESVMRLRDDIIPIIPIEKLLKEQINKTSNEENYVVVVKSGDRLAGIIVQHLLEQQEFVIKPLGGFLGELKGIAGASILGNGHTALILDIPTIMRMVKHQNTENLMKTLVNA